MEQAHAHEPLVVINALDRVSVQLELGDDGGREVNPAGVQLRKSDRLAGGVVQSLQQPLLLGVSERRRRIVDLPRDWGRVECFRAALLPLGRWRLGGFGHRPPLHPGSRRPDCPDAWRASLAPNCDAGVAVM